MIPSIQAAAGPAGKGIWRQLNGMCWLNVLVIILAPDFGLLIPREVHAIITQATSVATGYDMFEEKEFEPKKAEPTRSLHKPPPLRYSQWPASQRPRHASW